MDWINQIIIFYNFLLDFINTVNFLIIFIGLTIGYQFLSYLLIDRKYIKKNKIYFLDDEVKRNELNSYPLVNIVVPAWKEGAIFKDCLASITNLTYSNLKVIVNAGGNEETIEIAKSFEKFENFIILHQKEGGGKIKAINDAIKYVSEGNVIFIDADIYLNDDIFNDLIYPIINMDEDIVNCPLKPHRSQVNKNFVKYIYINRYARRKKDLTRYLNVISPCTCMKYDVLQNVGKFPERELLGDGRVIGNHVINAGFKIYRINHSVESFNFPDKIQEYFHQNVRWFENLLMHRYRTNKLKLIATLIYVFISLYILIFPFLFLVNLGLGYIGLILFLNSYLKKLRNYWFFKETVDDPEFKHIKIGYFIKMIFYIILDILVNLLAIFELVFYKKRYKTRKNIS
jgi:glycosyltransferase involved in cell wall biosynthesis